VKMWSGRFRQPLDQEFERWQRSFPFDQCCFRTNWRQRRGARRPPGRPEFVVAELDIGAGLLGGAMICPFVSRMTRRRTFTISR
jgi:hypothetical protein